MILQQETQYRPLTRPVLSKAFLILLSLCSVLGHAYALASNHDDDANSAFLEYLEQHYTLEERIELITHSAEGGLIIEGLMTPEWLVVLASEEAIQTYLNALTEPLSNNWLDALEVIVQRDEFDTARFRAAVLLFRHNRETGRAYLLNELQQKHNLQAALVFAVAQEPGTEGAIADAMITALANRKSLNHLNDAIEHWNNDELIQALSQPQVREAFEARSASATYARLVASAGDNDLRTILQEASFDRPDYWLSTRMTFAAALIRNDPDNAAARNFLLDQLQERPNWQTFDAIAKTHDPQFVAPLTQAISNLLSEDEEESRDMAVARVRAAISAVEAIVRLGGDVSILTVESLYDQIEQFSNLSSNYQRLELALLQRHNPAILLKMIDRHGLEETQRLLALQELKPVPDTFPRYVPHFSRGWVWY